VLSILRWGNRSWRPWIISIVIELVSQLAVRKGYESKNNGSRSHMMALEKQEFNRRLKLILLNVMRGAFYLKVTRPRLERFCNRTESKPIVSMAAGTFLHIFSFTCCITNHVFIIYRCPSRLFAFMGKDLLLYFCFIIISTPFFLPLIIKLYFINQPIIIIYKSFTKKKKR
jgi:hypothetical protein